MIPARGLLQVRPVETAESLPGSRILLTPDTRDRLTANQCEVIAVGAFAVCDDDDCERKHRLVCEHDPAQCSGATCGDLRVHEHDAVAGDWLLVTPRSFIDGPDPERKEWFVHQDAILAIFDEKE